MKNLSISSWTLWILTTLFFCYQFILRLSPGVLFSEIQAKFNIDATSFAVMTGCYYLGYAGMQIPVGILLDKIGVRYTVAISALICVIGNLPFIYSDNWVLALIGRFLIGFGSAAGTLGAIKAVRLNFHYDSISKMIGWTVTLGLVGAINGKYINLYLINLLGWKNALLLLTIPGALIAVLILVFVKKRGSHDDDQMHDSVTTSLLAVIGNPQVILLALFGALLVGPLEAFADVWGTPYFMNVYGLTKAQASYLSGSSIYFGMCIGSPLLAWLVDRFKCHYIMNIFCGSVMGVIFLIFIYKITLSYNILFILCFIIGIMCAYQVIVFASSTDLVPPSLIGIVISFVNMVNMAAGFAFHYFIGKIMDSNWDGLLVDGIKIYSEIAYNEALFCLPITLFIGAIGFNKTKN
jgi:fucose permease